MISQDESALRTICSGEIDQKYEKWPSQCLPEDIKQCGSPKKYEITYSVFEWGFRVRGPNRLT
jgi:hypothetical protein